MKAFVIGVFLFLGFCWADTPESPRPGSAEAASQPENPRLINCPDCGEPVSRRAVSCPHCGCPGEAIAEEVRRLETQSKPSPFLKVRTPQGESTAIAIRIGNEPSAVSPFDALGTLESLSLTSAQGDNVPYTRIQLAADQPLVRLPILPPPFLKGPVRP